MMNTDSAILHGVFLRAEKQCLPLTLSSIQKADWSGVGHPLLEAIKEICGLDELCAVPSTTAHNWIKQLICVVWLKLLYRETGEDVDIAWRENPFFALQNGLPEVNHVVLLEMVKSMATAQIFAGFLSYLPKSLICNELERLVQHMRSSPTSEDEVIFLLEVWWELWKGKNKANAVEGDNIEAMFARQFQCLSSRSTSLSPQAAKRLKLDPSEPPASSSSPDVLHILLHALKCFKGHIFTTDICLQALSISLDSIYTTFLIDHTVILSTKEKMNFLSKVASITQRDDENLSPELISEAQRDLYASHTPSQFQPSRMKLCGALKIITELVQFWQRSGLLKLCDNTNSSCSAFKLEQSVQRVLTALQNTDMSETVAKIDDREPEKNILRGLLGLLSFPSIESTPEVKTRVAAIIISHHHDDFQNFAALFASERNWAACEEHWMDCLENNPGAFQQCETLIKLTSTLMNKLHSNSTRLDRYRKLIKVVADIFSALNLEDKNTALAAMLRLSSRGFFCSSVPLAVSDKYKQELNMAFNCIIHGGVGATGSQGNLNTAVSLVAKVAFQNPEAAVRACCHSAIFNKGASSLMVKILQQLPGLRGQRDVTQSNEEEMKEDENVGNGQSMLSGSGLLCRCLQGIIKTKSLSSSEKEQLLEYLGLLMTPVMKVEGEEKKQSFVIPQEVVNIIVLPNLSTMGKSSFDVELSLHVLHTALSVDVQQTPHWVLNCSPCPLLYVLAQLHNQTIRCREEPSEGAIQRLPIETKELLVSLLTMLGQVVGAEVVAAPSSWSRALFWLYNNMEKLDWTIRFYLKPLWGEHFKNEVPSSLLTVCDLPEQDWSGLDLPQYSHGTGLLAWMECCSISDSLQSTMLSHLTVDQRQLDHVTMFSKGLMVALAQILPWCSISQWSRLLRVLKALITSGRLHVPFSLEYVDYLPLLDLRRFSCELRLSVLLLRVLQLLCGSSCSHWMSAGSWEHVGLLYAHAVRGIIISLRAKLPHPSSSAAVSPTIPASTVSNPSCTSIKSNQRIKSKDSETQEEVETAPCQEVLFILSQLFCHVQHVQVMKPAGQCEPLFLSSLEILSYYEAIMAAFPDSSSALESDNIRHFFSTITDNLENQAMKAVLQQKIAQLVSTAA